MPIAVTAITSSALASSGIGGTNALPQMVPSVQLTRSGPAGLFFVRGVGTTSGAAGEEGANAVYVDGVYVADLAQTINNFNNIERVEILKGPQGTLFGRNATGGLIHIITRDPGDTLSVRGQVGYANYDTVSGQFYLGGPITNNMSANIALTGSDQNKGWGFNQTRGRKVKTQSYWGVRSKLVFRPGNSVKITLAGDYNESDDDLTLAWRIDDRSVGFGGFRSPGGQDTTANDPQFTSLDIWGASLTIEADLGFARLTGISALRNSTIHSLLDVDGGPSPLIVFDYVSSSRSYQQELRLASRDTEPFSWQAGIFYLRTIAKNDQQQRGALLPPAFSANGGADITAELTTDSYAAFGEATYSITPTTHLTAGVRYTEDKRRFGGDVTSVSATGALGVPVVVNSRLEYGEWSYRGSIRQDITDNVNIYASINRGFKAGTYSLQVPTNAPVRPQFITAYEIGLKSQLFDRRLRLNLAAYHYKIEDYQVRTSAGPTSALTLLLNAATVKVDGFDAEFEALVTDRLRLFGGATLLDSKFASFPNAPFLYLNPAMCDAVGTADPGTTTGAPTGGLRTCFGDASGKRTPMAPKFSASIGGSYSLPISEDSQLRFSAIYSYNSGYVFEPDSFYGQPKFDLINASVEYRSKGHWGLELWARNIANTKYLVQNLTTATGTIAAPAAPRTYGVNLKMDF